MEQEDDLNDFELEVTYEDHPLASMFPLMNKEQLKELADDIEQNGMKEQIVLYQGKILDGRNRYRACKMIDDIDPSDFRTYQGNDPEGFVISKNLHRRHLTTEDKRKLAEMLRNRGLKQEQIAIRLNMTQQGVSKLLQPSCKMLHTAKKTPTSKPGISEKPPEEAKPDLQPLQRPEPTSGKVKPEKQQERPNPVRQFCDLILQAINLLETMPTQEFFSVRAIWPDLRDQFNSTIEEQAEAREKDYGK